MNKIFLSALVLVPALSMAAQTVFDADMTGTLLHTYVPAKAQAGTNAILNAKGKAAGFGNPIQFSGVFAGSNTVSTARTIWAGFTPAVGAGGGQSMQLGVLALADNVASAGSDVVLYVSVYTDNPSLVGEVPRGTALATNVALRIADGNPLLGGASQFVSDRFSVSAPLVAGTKYWLAIAPANTPNSLTPANWATIVCNSISGSNMDAQSYTVANFGIWQYNNNSGNLGGSGGVQFSTSLEATNVIAAQLRTNPNPAAISGNLTLADTSATFAFPRTISYAVKQGSVTIQTGSVVSSATVTPYAISVANSLTGNTTIEWDGGPFLLRKTNLVLTGSNQTANVSLQNGDVDDSGEVDAADIDIVIANFGSTLDITSDVDVSGEVDAADIDIVIANFGGTND